MLNLGIYKKTLFWSFLGAFFWASIAVDRFQRIHTQTLFFMLLMIPFTSIEVAVVGQRLNRGGGYGLEITVKYRF